MKKLLQLTLFLIISNLSYSQKLTLVDLKYIYEQNTESTNNYLLKKGFNFFRRKSNELTTITSYSGKNQTFVIQYGGLCKYQFYDSKIYTSIRDECIKNGFRLVDETTETPEDSGLTFIFVKGKSCIYFSSINILNKTKYIISYCGDPYPGTDELFHMGY